MTDETWMQKFDRWWAENPPRDHDFCRQCCEAAFLAGAAAERAERARGLTPKQRLQANMSMSDD